MAVALGDIGIFGNDEEGQNIPRMAFVIKVNGDTTFNISVFTEIGHQQIGGVEETMSYPPELGFWVAKP